MQWNGSQKQKQGFMSICCCGINNMLFYWYMVRRLVCKKLGVEAVPIHHGTMWNHT